MPTKKVLLIVEDEDVIAQTLGDALRTAGYEVLRAADGKKGLEVAKEHKPDLILLDIVMPVMGGMEMFKALRKDKWGKSVKVIFLTNLSGGTTINEALDQQACDYVVKSDWRLEDVLILIGQRLRDGC